MDEQIAEPTTELFSLVAPAAHSLHKCGNAESFRECFAAKTGLSIEQAVESVVHTGASRAIFLVGSLPLGMATSASDIDFIVVVDSKAALASHETGVVTNTTSRLAFSNDHNPLVVGSFVTLTRNIGIEVQVVIAPTIAQVYSRLRSRGPELSESEIQTLSRLSTGWLLSESEGYLKKLALNLRDPALDVYCATRFYVDALILRRKALKARDLKDVPLALHLGRSSVEKAYLAYFASEGISYLGPKWVAQLTQARDTVERTRRHLFLTENLRLLFPAYGGSKPEVAAYLQAVSEFLTAIRQLIERKALFRIAFNVCPQIFSIEKK